MGAPERAHYAKKSEIARATEVTSMEYVRRRQNRLGIGRLRIIHAQAYIACRDQTGQRLDGVQRVSSEWKNVADAHCSLFRMEVR